MTEPATTDKLNSPSHSLLHRTPFNAMAFNATGDGNTDDTTNVQSAANAAGSGGGLYFPYGTYLINTQNGIALTSKSNIKITGERAIIKMHGSATDGWYLFTFTNCTDIEICGLAFDRNNNDRYGGLRFYNCQRVWIHDCKFIDSDKAAVGSYDRYGIVFGFGSGQSSEIFIYDNYLQYQEIEVDYAKNVHIHHNIIDQSILGASIAVASIDDNYSAENYNIYENIITDPYNSAIAVVVDVSGKTGNTFRNIHIHDNTITKETHSYSFIYFGGAGTDAANTFEDCSVKNNKCYITDSATGTWNQDPGLIGISSSGTPTPYFDRFVIEGNEIYGSDQSARAIYAKNFRDGVIAHNKIYEVRYGIKFDAATRCQIHDNIAKRGASSGSYAYEFTNSGGENKIYDNKALGSWSADWYVSSPASTDKFYDASFDDQDMSDNATSGGGEDDLATKTVIANTLGVNGGLRIKAAGTISGANDTKTINLYFGASSWTIISAAAGDETDWEIEAEIFNTATNAQRIRWRGQESDGTLTSGYETAAIDTTANVTLKLTGQCTNASDIITQTMWIVERI